MQLLFATGSTTFWGVIGVDVSAGDILGPDFALLAEDLRLNTPTNSSSASSGNCLASIKACASSARSRDASKLVLGRPRR